MESLILSEFDSCKLSVEEMGGTKVDVLLLEVLLRHVVLAILILVTEMETQTMVANFKWHREVTT